MTVVARASSASALLRVTWRLFLGVFTLWFVSHFDVVRADPAADALSIVGSPEFVTSPQTGWRITWRTVPGRDYRLERNDNLSDPLGWTPVVTLTATGETTSHIDPAPADVPRRFWRVALLPGGADTEAPAVGQVQAFVKLVHGDLVLELRVAASDNVGVVGVVFLGRPESVGTLVPLGDAARDAADDLWKLIASLPGDPTQQQFFAARARDAAGNETQSPESGFTFATASEFAALGPNGAPQPGALVPIDENGNLGPFGVRAGGGGLAGVAADVMLLFPEGGRIVEQGGRRFVEFVQGEVRFGPGGPLRLREPLLRTGTGLSGAGFVATSGDPVLLPLENPNVAEIEAAFGLTAGAGLGLKLFGIFDLRLMAGTFSPRGIEGAVFKLEMANLPLPELSGAYAGFTLDFSDPNELKLPFYGEFTLPEAKGPGATLRAPRSNPIVLALRADGSIGLKGRVELRVPGGGRYSAELTIDDPNYAFGLSAGGIEVPFLSSFAQLLPDNAPALVPATTDATQLAFATRALESYARAFFDFSAAAVANAPVPENLENGGDRPPGDTGAALARVLDAWAFAAASPAVHGVADDAVTAALARLARVGSGATDLTSAAEHLAAAARLRAVLNDPAFAAQQPGAIAQLEQAMFELEKAVIFRAREPSASASVEALFETTRHLLDVMAARQLLGFDNLGLPLLDTIEDLYRRFLADYTQSLGVSEGQFNPATNPLIAGMNRYLAFERTVRLLDLLAALQLLGLDTGAAAIEVPLDELFTQLAARAAAALRTELAAAEAAGDARTFLDLYTDLLDLEAYRQLGVLPQTPAALAVLAANGLPDPFDFDALEQRYAAVRAIDVTLDLAAPNVADAAREVARLNRLVERIPGGLTQAVVPAARALERLDDALGVAVAGVGGLSDPSLLAELIVAGTQHARLARRLTGAPQPSAPWETQRLVAIVDRFTAVAPAQRPWAELHRAAQRLLTEADVLGLEAEDPNLTVGQRTDRIAARRNNLVEAAKLIQAARGVAAATWQATETALAQAGQFGVDALLPGNIEVQNVAGAFAFNRLSGAWRGSLAGAVRLPGLLGGATLALERASFASSGEYEALAFGAIAGVPLGSLTGNIEVPARRPLRIRHELGRPLRLAGSAKLSLSNGVFFEGYLDFEDPIYRFGASAGGVRLDLADKLIGYTPQVTLTLPFTIDAQNQVIFDTAFQELTKETATAVDDWFRSLGATLEPVAGLFAPPQLGPPGTPPDFQEPAFTFEFDGVNAFFNGLASTAALNLDAGYQAVLAAAKADLERAATEAERSPSIGDNLAVYLQTLRRAEEMRRINERLRLALDELAANQIAGIEFADVAADPRVLKFYTESQAQVDRLFTNPLTTGNLGNASRVVRLAFDSDATGQLLGIGGDFFIGRVPAFLEATYGSYLESLGLNRTTGAVANPTVFEGLTRRQLGEALRELGDLEAAKQASGSDVIPASFSVAAQTLALRLRALAAAAYAETPAEDWERRAELLREFQNTSILIDTLSLAVPGDQPRLLGGSGPFSMVDDANAVFDQIDSVTLVRERDLRNRAANPLYDFLAELRRITNRDFPEQVLARTQREIQRELDRLLPSILGLLPTDAIPDSRRLLDDLIKAADAAAEFSFTAQLNQIGQVAIPNLTVRLTAIAEVQKAWWVLSDYTRLLVEAAERQRIQTNAVLRQAVQGSIVHSLEMGRRVTNAIAADVAARIAANVEPFELRLPGDLTVHRVFGDFVFERNVPRFTATFGGELEFPEIETLLTINAATIATDGTFALDVATKGPIEAGGDSLKYELALVVQGSQFGVLQNATGTGKLRVKKAGAAPGAPEDEYTVSVAYTPQAVAPAPVFKLQSAAAGIFIFDTDLVLFEANAALEFTRQARTGTFRLGGTAGTLAKREDFTRDDVQRKDFRLLFEDVALGFAYRPDGFAASIEGARVVLDPELFELKLGSVNCDDKTNPAPGTGQAPFAQLLTPLTIDVTFLPGGGTDFAFLGGPNGTDLAFGNFGFEIPGMPGLAVDVCNVALRFPARGLPVLRNLDARLTIPLDAASALAGSGSSDLSGASLASTGGEGGGLAPANTTVNVVRTRLGAKDWGLDGFPSELSVTLENDLPLLDLGPLSATLLGPTTIVFGFEENGPLFTTFFGAASTLRLEFDADVAFDLDNNAGIAGQVSAAFGVSSTFNVNTGNFGFDFDLAVTEVALCGRIRIGGPGGLEVGGLDAQNPFACLSISTASNLLALGDDPLTVALTGRIGSEQFAFFILDNARFTFDLAGNVGFAVAGFGFEAGETIKLLGEDLLPVQLTAGRLDFVNDSLPLIPAPGQPGLLELPNLVFSVSGAVNIGFPPDPQGTAPGEGLPRLFGAVDDLKLAFPQGFAGLPTFSIDTFVLTLENLSIGDFAGLTGGVAFGNLNDPANLFFGGQLGGGFKGVGIKAIFAATLKGPIGLCLDVNAGPAGIPIDGGTLGGVLLTGAKGGVAFGNTFVDPCDFKALLGLGADGRPTGASPPNLPIDPASTATGDSDSALMASLSTSTSASDPAVPASLLVGMSWEELAQKQARHERLRRAEANQATIERTLAAASAATGADAPPSAEDAESGRMSAASMDDGLASTSEGHGGGTNDSPPELSELCPKGDCPPPTINLFCQRHPSFFESPGPGNYDGTYAGSIIFKFTSLQPEDVDQILHAIGLNPANLQGTPQSISTAFAAEARAVIELFLEPLRPCSPVDDPQCPLDAQFREDFDAAIDDFEVALRDTLQAALEVALGGNRPLIDALYEAAYAGAPCIDLTVVLEGTISHSVVSTVLSVSGGATLSTTGTAGVFGSINLLGIPAGTVDLFFSLTDRLGDPNPSLCGGAFVGLGPLELGRMDFALECPGCGTGVLQALADFVAGVASDAGAGVDGLIRQWIADAQGVPVAAITAPLPAYFGPTGETFPRDKNDPLPHVPPPLMPQSQQMAVMAQFFNVPALVDALGGLAPDAAQQLQSRVVDLIVDLTLAVDPQFGFCGMLAPKIFGLPLGGELLGANLFYGTIEDAGVRYQLLSGQARFSPSWFLFNAGLVIGSGGNIPPFIPGIDQANLGFATRVVAFDRDSLLAFLADPIGGTLDRMQQVVENATITFGYQLEPFGIRLANGQGRIVMPQLDYHPNNPNRIGGPWQLPPAGDFATRRQLLLAAADRDKLQEPTWTGRAGQLGELFDDPALAANMNTKDLVRDYFPHGGILGASRLLFPRPITDPPPAELFRVFAEDRSLLDRWNDLQFVFESYLTATTEVGQLVLYFPAPNPPTLLWNDPANPPDPLAFVEALKTTDIGAILASGGSLEFYAFDQVFMLGEAGVRILGVPLFNADLTLDGAAGLFRVFAEVPENGWLERLLGLNATLEFQIGNPRYLEAAGGQGTAFLPPDQANMPTQAEVFAAAVANLEGKSGAQLQLALAESTQMVLDTLPRVSLEAAVNFNLPPEFGDFLRAGAGASFAIFGFSPGFDPDFVPLDDPFFDPLNPDPYTVAKRAGGFGFRGSLQFGYFPAGIEIDIPTASLAIGFGGFDNVMPAFTGLLRVDTFALPGGYEFDQGFLQFNSKPAVGGDFINVRGRTTPIDLGPFLQVQPLNPPAPGEPPRIAGSFRVTNTGAPIPAIALAIDPTRATIPLLGDSLVIDIYGSQDPQSGEFTPFTFSSVSGQPWAATLRIAGALQVRDPFNLDGPVLFEVEAAGGVPFMATIDGVGLDEFTLRVTIPNGVTVRAFPGQVTQTEWTVGDANATCLLVQSNGRIYLDSGTRTFPLAGGAMEVTGRVELGFEPFVLAPMLDSSPAILSFGSVAALGGASTQNVSVRNNGFGRLVVDATVTAAGAHYSVTPNRLVLGPGENSSFAVRYLPQSVSSHPGTLALTSNGGNANIPLAGTGTGSASFARAPTGTLAFGTNILGTSPSLPLVVTNSGTANLTLSSVTTTGPYTVSPTSATITPGSTRLFNVTYRPSAVGSQNGTLTFVTNVGNQNVALTGAGSSPNSTWRRQRHGGPDLRGGHQLVANIGWAVGDEGTVLRTTDGGRTWFNFGLGRESWRDIVFEWVPADTIVLPDELRGLIVGASGRVELSTDAGRSWNTMVISRDAGVATAEWRTAARRTHTDFVIAGRRGNNAIVATEQSTGEWLVVEKTGVGPINGVAFLSERFSSTDPIRPGIAAGENGALLRSDDGGKTWNPVALPAGVPAGTRFVAVSASQQNTVGERRFLVVGQPNIVMTSFDGLAWTVHTPPGNLVGEFTAGAWTGNNVGQIGSSSGQIYRFDANTSSFSSQNLRPYVPLRKPLHNRQTSESGGDSTDIWFVGDQGTIMRRPTTFYDGQGNPISNTSYIVDPLSFGTAGGGNVTYRTVTVTNGGVDQVLVGTSLSGSAAFGASPTEATIPPGETQTFVLWFKPGPGASGQQSATVTFTENSQTVFSMPITGVSSPDRWVLVNPPSNEDFVGAAQLSASTFVLAAERNVYRTTNSAASWSTVVNNLNVSLAALSFANATFGAVGGGDGTGPTPSVILTTANGGVNWTSRTAPTLTGVADLHYVELSGTSREATGITRSSASQTGRVIESNNSATSWFVSNSRPIDGNAVWRNGTARFAATANELLYASTPTGAFSTLFSSQGLKPSLRDIFFVDANRGWVVGSDGAVYTTTTGGATSGAWVNRSNVNLGDIRQVVFIDEAVGFIATETENDTRIYRSTNGGREWTLQHLEPKRPGGPKVRGFTSLPKTTPIAYGTKGGLWRFVPGQPVVQGFLLPPARIDLGSVGIGQTGGVRPVIQNPGFADVTILDVVVDALGTPNPFGVDGGGGFIPFKSADTPFTVTFRPTALGEFRATLRIMSDAYNGEIEVELVGRGVAPPATILVETRPTGGTITVGGLNRPSGTVFNVVESGGTGNSLNWNRGTSRTLAVPATRILNGVSYRFSHWTTGGATHSISYTAGSESAQLVAHYVPTPPTPAPPPAPPTFLPNPCAHAAPPADVPQGPWMKVSQATVRLPNVDGGHTTAVEGSLLLSLTQANGTLRTSTFRAFAPAGLGGFEIVEVTAGSWRFDLGTFPFTVDGQAQNVLGFRLQTNTPGLELFDRPAMPPSSFDFILAWNPQTPFAPPLIAGQFATGGELPIIPSVLQFGPSNVDFAVSPSPGIGVSGTARAIARPIGGFYFNQAFSYRLGTPNPQLGTGTTTLADFGFVRVRGDAQSRFILSQNAAGVFSVGLSNLLLDGWTFGGTAQRFGASVSTNGLVQGELFMPSTGVDSGPFRLVPVTAGGSPTEGAAIFSVNVFQHAYVFSLPRIQLRSVNGFWANNAFVFDGLSIDTASDFERRFGLPSQIAGIALPAGVVERNHALLERKNGFFGLRVRSEQSLLFGEMRLRFRASGAGVLSGSLSGTAVEPFTGTELGSVSMTYDSAGAPFQFDQCFGFFFGDFRLRFGSGGAQIQPADCN